MNMDAVKELMAGVQIGLLATTDGERASLRPMGAWAWVDGDLWCAAASDSVKVADIAARPSAEYCFSGAEGMHVRISGDCRFTEDEDDKKKIFDLHPLLAQIFGTPDAPGWGILKMKVGRVRTWSQEKLGYNEIEQG